MDRFALLERVNAPVFLTMDSIEDPRINRLASFDTETNRDVIVYWLGNALSRAYFASGASHASTHADVVRALLRADFQYWNTVILEGPDVLEAPGQVDAGRVRISNYENSRAVCEVEARVPGYLVLLDSYYPGWRAYVDGVEVRILRANYAFRAVQVGAGNHRVEFIYRPRSFYLGLWISGVALVLAAGSLMWPLLSKMSARIISR